MPTYKYQQTSGHEWSICETESGATFSLLPFRNYSEPERYSLKTVELNCVYGIYSNSVEECSNARLYSIATFSAQSKTGETLTRRVLRQAFLDTVKQIMEFLKVYEIKSGSNQSVLFSCELNLDPFRTWTEERDENIKLTLGDFHFHLMLTRVLLQLTRTASIAEMCEKTDLCSLDDHLRDAAVEQVADLWNVPTAFLMLDYWDPVAPKDNIAELCKRWLIPTVNSEELYENLISKYLDHASELPESETYVSRHYAELIPFVKNFGS